MKMKERRDFYRKGLHTLYLPYYDGVCRELSPEWQPYWGFREYDAQEMLYGQGRTHPGKIVTNARGGESAHNYGCASDWTIWDAEGKPVWLKDTDKKWKELERACEETGAGWGGHFKSPDCPHVQLELEIPWKSVRRVYLESGLTAAMIYVREQLV